MASRSLIGLYRTLNPSLLLKKDRGRGTKLKIVPKEYGENKPAESISGIELLEQEDQQDDNFQDEVLEDSWIIDDRTGKLLYLTGNDTKNDSREGDDKELEKSEPDTPQSAKANEKTKEVESEQEIEKETEELEPLRDTEDEETKADEANAAEDAEESPEEMEDDGIEEKIERENQGIVDKKRKAQDLDEGDLQNTASNETSEASLAQHKPEISAPPKKKPRLDQIKILTEEDFRKIARKKEELKEKGELLEVQAPAAEVDPTDIEGFTKKQKLTKDERFARVMEGRKDRGKFGIRKERPVGSSTTNKEKVRKTPFMLAKQKKSVKAKLKLSVRDKQLKKKAARKKRRYPK